eukprot:2814773-Rhodomonas_salina.1
MLTCDALRNRQPRRLNSQKILITNTLWSASQDHVAQCPRRAGAAPRPATPCPLPPTSPGHASTPPRTCTVGGGRGGTEGVAGLEVGAVLEEAAHRLRVPLARSTRSVCPSPA